MLRESDLYLFPLKQREDALWELTLSAEGALHEITIDFNHLLL